jgi:hypothetical protein
MRRVTSVWNAAFAQAGATMLLGTAALIWSSTAHAQLRVVTYNTTGSPDAGMNIVLKSIGEEVRNGIAKPIDILLLQEQNNPFPGANSPSSDTQSFVALLNSIYNSAGITYAMGNRTGAGDTTQTIVYRTQTIQSIQSSDETLVASSAPRDTLRYRVRPVGYTTSAADLYIYNSHYKASLDATPPGTNATQRNAEATAIRANSNALGEGAHAIYAGDHNFYYSDAQEPAWGTLTAAGAGQANDPIDRIGNWHNNGSFADVHTQSPCASSSAGCGAGGGMDDRFDFQLVTGELKDGEGLAYIGPVPGISEMAGLAHSYHAFGNNGSTFNDDINAGNTVTFPGVSSYTQVQILNALHVLTDHIPVVADYQVPAIMNAVAGALPASVDLGQSLNLAVTVSNVANVVAAIGADELNYSLTTSGSLTGSFLNQVDMALGSGNAHLVGLNTSSIGMKTGTITITSTSQGVQTTAAVQNGMISIPVSFLVVLPGDYNGNGIVDGADYVLWRNSEGQSVTTGTGADGDRNGTIGPGDYTVWRSHFGDTASGVGAAAAVPEGTTLVLALVGVCLGGLRRTTLREWTRKK